MSASRGAPKSHEEWRAELRDAFQKLSKRFDAAKWDAFAPNVFYCAGEFGDAAAYQKLRAQLDGFGNELLRRNVVFYLATSPSQFAEICEHLRDAELLTRSEGERDDPAGGGGEAFRT